MSNVVRELAKGKNFLFADRGEASLKGFDEPVRLYEIRWQEYAVNYSSRFGRDSYPVPARS